ncbi:MAG TPA: hypothetical protein VGQ58_05380 [Candidatus Limnocylindrales bacterium]|jgi:hypothetical protein|nr:hypothetical protein [Candidatus Limnocylindrales bacterium]
MRNFAAPRWVIVAGSALGTYLFVLALTLLWVAGGDYGYELTGLNRLTALIAGLMLGLPTILLTVLLTVRRVAHIIGAAAATWLAFNAYVWLPVQPVLAAWAAGVALVVLGATVADWRRNQVGSTRSRPQR